MHQLDCLLHGLRPLVDYCDRIPSLSKPNAGGQAFANLETGTSEQVIALRRRSAPMPLGVGFLRKEIHIVLG